MKLYEDGADGISTFNWVPHLQPGMVKDPTMRKEWGSGAIKVQMFIHPKLKSPEEIRRYLEEESPC